MHPITVNLSQENTNRFQVHIKEQAYGLSIQLISSFLESLGIAWNFQATSDPLIKLERIFRWKFCENCSAAKHVVRESLIPL